MTKEEMKDRVARAEEIQRYTENRCDALEKENAELKEKVRTYESGYAYEKMYELKVQAQDRLTKATKLLNEFMRISKASDEDFEHDYSELIGETEQFIKEIEK